MIGEKTIRTTWDLAHECLETNQTKPFLIEDFLIKKQIKYDQEYLQLLIDMVDTLSSRRNQHLPLHEQIKADVDDELDLMKQRIQAHYNLSEEEAVKLMNHAIKELF